MVVRSSRSSFGVLDLAILGIDVTVLAATAKTRMDGGDGDVLSWNSQHLVTAH